MQCVVQCEVYIAVHSAGQCTVAVCRAVHMDSAHCSVQFTAEYVLCTAVCTAAMWSAMHSAVYSVVHSAVQCAVHGSVQCMAEQFNAVHAVCGLVRCVR